MSKVVTDLDRTVNYVQAQLAQADEFLTACYERVPGKKIIYAHMVQWKKELETELHELRKQQRRAK